MNPILQDLNPWLWFTLGPATIDYIDEALLGGANGVRYTLSYATPELHIDRAKMVSARAASLGVSVYAVADLPGEKFRLASFPGERVVVDDGDRIQFSAPSNTNVRDNFLVLPVRNENFLSSAGPGTSIVVGDGGVELLVEDAMGGFLTCQVIRGGVIENNRGLTLVGGTREPISLTPSDLAMLRVTATSGVFDAIALSFASDPADIRVARDISSNSDRPIDIIAKIETRSGLDRIDEICREADIVMAARGDLALAIAPFMLYSAVAHIADSALTTGVPWILATQLLEGLDHNGFPTRAELTDVVAWMDRGAAGAMLSRETVFGGKPLESIRFLSSLLNAPRTWSSDLISG